MDSILLTEYSGDRKLGTGFTDTSRDAHELEVWMSLEIFLGQFFDSFLYVVFKHYLISIAKVEAW